MTYSILARDPDTGLFGLARDAAQYHCSREGDDDNDDAGQQDDADGFRLGTVHAAIP
jgi:hypothetical protein